ncbi:hypothetical protein [Nonomuraea dietziae]|uniref:hypothetical protein n=1 Tax=Nonomuraea dietziae TaxID=65515 RepID=UPI0031E10FC4
MHELLKAGTEERAHRHTDMTGADLHRGHSAKWGVICETKDLTMKRQPHPASGARIVALKLLVLLYRPRGDSTVGLWRSARA